MGCVYDYNGLKFGSETALEDFLTATEGLEPILGDMVFSSTISEEQKQVLGKLESISQKVKEVEKLRREWEANGRISYDEDGEVVINVPPYIGVNSFLARTTINGKQLYNEFIDDEYWSRRFQTWRTQGFSLDEIKTFQEVKGWDPNNLPAIDESLYEGLKKIILEKWKNQAKAGDAVHKILLLYFSRDSKGEYVFNYSDPKTYIFSRLSDEMKQWMTGDNYNKIFTMAEKLRKEYQAKFGDTILFFPEFSITDDAIDPTTDKEVKLYGIIDMLIIDANGRAHIIDYKTSIKGYSEFGFDKLQAFKYQISTYQRILLRMGINTYGGKLFIVPIKLINFGFDRDRYKFDGVDYSNMLQQIDHEIPQYMWDSIDTFLPAKYQIQVTATELEAKRQEFMLKWFPKYSSSKVVEEAEVIEMLKGQDALKQDDEGWFSYKPVWGKEIRVKGDESKFVKKVHESLQSQENHRVRMTSVIKTALEEGIKQNSPDINLPESRFKDTHGVPTWLKDTLGQYCSENWKVVTDDTLELYGIILLQNVNDNRYDVIRISPKSIKALYRKKAFEKDPIGKRENITGTFEADVRELVKTDSLMLRATNGNIESIETMLILNQINSLQGARIGSISVVNPNTAQCTNASNEELLYCWNKLNEHESLTEDNFRKGDIKLCDKCEIVAGLCDDILSQEPTTSAERQKHSQLKECKANIDQAVTLVDTDKKILALTKALKLLESIDSKLKTVYKLLPDLKNKSVMLHNNILFALAQLKGYNFRQQLDDHDKWIESFAVWKDGHAGSYIDNPGNLSSQTLNMLTTLVTEAYQNTRDDVSREAAVLRNLVADYKAELNFGYFQEITYGNLIESLYKNMTKFVTDGSGLTDLVFVKPSEVQSVAGRKLLEHVLWTINKNRYNQSDETLKQWRDNGDRRYYRVPLAAAQRKFSEVGLFKTLQNRLKSFKPKQSLLEAKAKLQGVYEMEDDAKMSNRVEDLFVMTNQFSKDDDSAERDRIINKLNKEGVERNLETLVLKHTFAYSVKENMDEVFPLIRAAVAHLTVQGGNLNTVFTDDLDYATEYITNKIFNKSIQKRESLEHISNTMRHAASLLTLALSPVQMIYQPLQGLWNDIRLFIQKPDGETSFTFNNLKRSLAICYSDLFKVSNKPTLCLLINEVYGLNDMDMNDYVNRLSSGKKGLWNIEQFLFKFASRPDFYNRMTIFLSKMMGDKCYDAHTVENGRLKYNYDKDGRFDQLRKGSGPEYAQQKALYYAMAKQFVVEKAKYDNGKLFELDMEKMPPLPKAYTNKEAESIKSLSDNIYGYYSHEKKSLIMSTFAGSLWLQFKTFWSGKKNLYVGKGGIKLQGGWDIYKEGDTAYYYQTDDKGNILYDLKKYPPLKDNPNKPLPPEQKLNPIVQWKGKWQEGILVTLAQNVDVLKHPFSVRTHMQNKWATMEPEIVEAQLKNLKLFGYDMFMWIIMGSWLSGLLKDEMEAELKANKKNTDLFLGALLTAYKIAVLSVRNSFLDFNLADSVGSPIANWTPFAFSFSASIYKEIMKAATGDDDLWDAVVSLSGTGKITKPFWDTLKPEVFRTKQEGGTFNVK